MKGNKGQAVIEMAILSVLIVVMLTVALQMTKYLEAMQKTQTAAFFAAQAWSIERPRSTTGDLGNAMDAKRRQIEARVASFLTEKAADGDIVNKDATNFLITFGTSTISPRVQIKNQVKIEFPWYTALGTELILPIKAKVETQAYPLFDNYE